MPQILDEAGGKHIQIISKIESQTGVLNFDSILEETDGGATPFPFRHGLLGSASSGFRPRLGVLGGVRRPAHAAPHTPSNLPPQSSIR